MSMSDPHTPYGEITFHDLCQDFDEALLSRFYADVLTPSFHTDELEPLEWFAQGLRQENETAVVASIALGSCGEVLGGLVAARYSGSNVLLLVYLAVRPDARCLGIGSRLLRVVAPQWYTDPTVLLAVGEVHDPRCWSGTPGENPAARLRLYERLGARVLAIPFIQPALKPGGKRVYGDLLMAFHVKSSASVVRSDQPQVRADLVSTFVRRYYEVTEGAVSSEDLEVLRLLDYIESRSEIPLLPVNEYHLVPIIAEP